MDTIARLDRLIHQALDRFHDLARRLAGGEDPGEAAIVEALRASGLSARELKAEVERQQKLGEARRLRETADKMEGEVEQASRAAADAEAEVQALAMRCEKELAAARQCAVNAINAAQAARTRQSSYRDQADRLEREFAPAIEGAERPTQKDSLLKFVQARHDRDQALQRHTDEKRAAEAKAAQDRKARQAQRLGQ